jgi:hypothetical protein
VVTAKVRGRLMVNKQGAQECYGVGFNLKQFRVLEIKEHFQIKISNRFAALENLYDSKHNKRAWESNRKTIKISVKENLGLYEWKQHIPWLDKNVHNFQIQGSRLKCTGFRIQTKDNLNNVRCGGSRYFRKKIGNI